MSSIIAKWTIHINVREIAINAMCLECNIFKSENYQQQEILHLFLITVARQSDQCEVDIRPMEGLTLWSALAEFFLK
jgi:hypothetical protein